MRRLGLIGLATAMSVGLPAVGQATTFTGTASIDTFYGCGSCSSPVGSVNVALGTGTLAGDLVFTVTLVNNYIFYSTGSSNNNSFVFDLQNTSGTVSISNISSTAPATWKSVNGPTLGDGIGTSWNYGVTLNDGTNGAGDNAHTLTFDVSETGGSLTLANIAQGKDKNNLALWFAADLGQTGSYDPNGGQGATGLFGASSLVTTTPLPGALALFFGPVLGAAGYLRMRRRRGHAGAAIAA
jgi:hypothetical protein